MLNIFADNSRMTNRRGSDSKTTQAIGARVAEALRESRFKTQGELAAKVGVKTQAVSYWTLGERLPGTQNCIDLSEALNISLDWLLLGRGEKWLKPAIKREVPLHGELVDIGPLPAETKLLVRGMVELHAPAESEARPKSKK